MSGYDVVTQHTKQPSHAFIEVSIAGHLLKSVYSGSRTGKTRSPEYVRSFEFTRIDDAGSFILTLFDRNWVELERVFNLGRNAVKIRYGYVEGAQSEVLECSMTNYSVKFHNQGVTLVLRGLVDPGRMNLSIDTIDTGTKNPTEAVKKICQALGYKIGKFTPSKNLSPEYLTSDSISVLKEHPISYINYKLASRVESMEGKGGYKLRIDSGTNPPTANFVPASDMIDTPVRSYIYGKGINSSVISLDLDIKGYFGGTSMSGGSPTTTEVEASTVDPTSGETTTQIASTSSTTEANNPDSDIELYTDTPATQKDVIDTSGLSDREAIALVSSVLSLNGSIPYSGTLTILGDPLISMFDNIHLTVLTTNGEVYEAASGSYMISGITDSVTNGKYITVLSIIKNTSASGSSSISSGSGGSSGGSDSNEGVSDSSDYSINKNVSTVRTILYVPSSGTGHMELQVRGDVVFKGKKITNPTFSYNSDSSLRYSTLSASKAYYANKSCKKYYVSINVSGDKFYDFIKNLEIYCGNLRNSSNGSYFYSMKGSYANYSISKINCVYALAQWTHYLGYDTIYKIYNSANSYKDYTLPVLYEKYGSTWTPYKGD